MHLFLQSLAKHLRWWLASLWPGAHPAAPLSLRRLIFLLLGYPLFLALQLVHWLGFLIDELLFSAYRKVEIASPVFIVGIPRSGTTFLHRTLASDSKFTFFATWEALLAPSITERKIIGAFATVDRAIGAPIKRLIQYCITKSSGDFDNIHEVGLAAPEEDYLALLPVGACFIMLLAFPFAKELYSLAKLDEQSEAQRMRTIEFYKRCLQKHLYCHPGKQLLSKNAAFSSWCTELASAIPGARFIVCIREPETALSSQISSLAPARQGFGADPDGSHTTKQFTEIYAHNYTALSSFVADSKTTPVALIEQSDLRADAATVIRSALQGIDLPLSEELDEALNRIPPNPSSKHQHKSSDFLIDPDVIEHSMQPAYVQMLNSPHRSQCLSP
jgi:hypothetical protein